MQQNARDLIRLLMNYKTFEQKFYLIFFSFSFSFPHTAQTIKHMGFPLICPICIKMSHTTAVSLQLHRQREGNDWENGEISVGGLTPKLWPDLEREWANKMTVIPPSHRSLLPVISGPSPRSQSVTAIAWWHYNLPKSRHNAPHQFNLVSKPD